MNTNNKETFSPIPLCKRMGKFSISWELLTSHAHELQDALFSRVVVVGCQMRWSTRSLHYEAMSELFDECDEAQEPPEYIFEFEKDEKNQTRITKISRTGSSA